MGSHFKNAVSFLRGDRKEAQRRVRSPAALLSPELKLVVTATLHLGPKQINGLSHCLHLPHTPWAAGGDHQEAFRKGRSESGLPGERMQELGLGKGGQCVAGTGWWGDAGGQRAGHGS